MDPFPKAFGVALMLLKADAIACFDGEGALSNEETAGRLGGAEKNDCVV